MTNPTRLWLCAVFDPAHRCGGWAFVRPGVDGVTGGAGGERYTSAARIALAGLAAGLRGLPAGAEPVEVRTDSAELAGFAKLVAGLGKPADEPPEEDLDLWAQITSLAASRRIGLVGAPRDAATPIGFAAAWAELARDKARATGPFTAAIPKANLAKVPGLG